MSSSTLPFVTISRNIHLEILLSRCHLNGHDVHVSMFSKFQCQKWKCTLNVMLFSGIWINVVYAAHSYYKFQECIILNRLFSTNAESV